MKSKDAMTTVELQSPSRVQDDKTNLIDSSNLNLATLGGGGVYLAAWPGNFTGLAVPLNALLIKRYCQGRAKAPAHPGQETARNQSSKPHQDRDRQSPIKSDL
eukprot:3086225-Amphidinium_carterae.1